MTRFLPFPVWLYAVVIAIALSLPYLAGSANTPPGWQYSGAAVVPGGFLVDYNSHMAKMWQGARGEWAYRLLFTHEPHPGLPGIQSFYVALGALAKLTGLSFPTIYHLARFLLTMALILALWRFACRFFDRTTERWTALLFGTVVLGWGWLLYFAAPLLPAAPEPIEFWLMDAYNLTGAFYMPHFSAAIVLQILAVLALMDWTASIRERAHYHAPLQLIWLTLILAALVLIQPYVVLLTFPLFGLMLLHDLWKKNGGRDSTISKLNTERNPHQPPPLTGEAFPSLPAGRGQGWGLAGNGLIFPYLWLIIPAAVHGGLAVLQFLLLRSDPVWINFTAQNITASPLPVYYVFGYLPFLIPIAFLAFQRTPSQPSPEFGGGLTAETPNSAPKTENRELKTENSELSTQHSALFVPLIWILIVCVLLYAPLPTQRRYLLGVQTPLAILAAAGWSQIIKRVKPRLRPVVAIPYFVLASVALLLMLTGNILGMTPAATPAAFYSPDELAGYAWLHENASPDALVLTTLDGEGKGSGGRLVAMTGMRVYLGHWIETADFLDKVDILKQFYQPETEDAWRRDLLESTGAQYVWYDDYARAFGTWSPAETDFLEAVFSSDTVTLYRVELDE